jgi:hypothetical protein
MNRNLEQSLKLAAIPLVVFAGSLPLTAEANAKNIKRSSECKAVRFAALKGGPGLMDVGVFPIVKNNELAEATISGKVIKGNDKGAIISNTTDSQYAGIAGEFVLTWNESSQKTQSATVELSVEVPGHNQLQACPETTLLLNPNNSHITPAYSKS